MDTKDIKKLLEGKDFAGQLDKLKGIMGKIPQVNELQKMIDSIKPKKQKNSIVLGNDCIVSIGIDNRVSVLFHDEITAEKYYEDFKCQETLITGLSNDVKRLKKEKSDIENQLKYIKDTKLYRFIILFKRK